MLLTSTGALALMALAAQADTTFAITQNDRLSLNNHSGSIEVVVWTRSEVQVTMDDDHVALHIERNGSEFTISRRGAHASHSTDYVLRVPAWLPLTFSGVNTDITVQGTEASVRGHTINGDIWVRGGQGLVSLNAVNGDVTVEGTSGRIQMESIDGDVTGSDLSGTIEAISVDGDVTLERVRSESVEARTVDGDVLYRGDVVRNGRYRLATHDGDVTLFAPGAIDAQISVSTFSGEFESDFPFTITGLAGKGKPFSFTLGSGAAEVILEAFDGSIALRQATN